MARATISVQNIVRAGLVVTHTPMTVDGVQFANGGATFISVKNTAGASATVTIQTAATYSDLALADLTVTVAAGTTKLIGPFPRGDFNDSSGMVLVDTNTATTTEIAAVQMP
jgi:hypothetical protein